MYCLPHAGGAASAFRNWQADLPDWIDVAAVRLPGRENRVGEPPEFTVEDVTDALLADCDDRPFAVFGHSMGGLLALEVCRALSDAGVPGLVHLAISGIGHPAVMPPPPRISNLPDEALATWLTTLGSVPDWALADEQFRLVLFRAVRSDCAWLERWVNRAAALDVGLSVFAGDADDSAPPPALAAWSRETTGRFRARRYPGGHFYLESQRAAVLADLTADLVGYRVGH